MQAKTIGSFLTILRKAKGLTQKELAEKLNVSDKTVSRWERDEGYPELSLIPVIAEIFDVTCDELLRGERRPNEDPDTSKKGEKQLQRILAAGLNRFQNRTYIAMGICVLGLIATLIAVYGFSERYVWLGFLIGCAFYLAGCITQIVVRNQAFLCVDGTEFNEQDVWRYKETVIKLNQRSFGLMSSVFAFSLSFVDRLSSFLLHIPYIWFILPFYFRGLIYTLAGLGIWYLICVVRNTALLKKGIIQISQERIAVRAQNKQTKRKCALWLLAALAITICSQVIVNNFLPVSLFEEPTRVFEDYDSFAVFMERDINFNPDAAHTETLKDLDGNILCEYELRNFSVEYIRYGGTIDKYLPISVYTTGNMDIYQAKMEVINGSFLILYALEIAAAAFCYFIKRKNEPA